MKRWALCILLLLLLGAIVNVAVAWGGQIPQLNSRTQWRALSFEESQRAWSTVARKAWPPAAAPFGIEYRNLIWSCLQIDSSTQANAPWGVVKASCGWPFEALQGFQYRDPEESSKRNITGVRITRPSFMLPYELLWPGFAINTVFYAGVLWLLFVAPFALRRRRRIKRGLCPKCAYDLRGGRNRPSDSTVCPECGGTLTRPA